MGMDLFSKRKPRGKEPLYYRFNWSGWSGVTSWLEAVSNTQVVDDPDDETAFDMSEIHGGNDGDVVSPNTCLAIAERIKLLDEAGRFTEAFCLAAETTPKEGLPRTELSIAFQGIVGTDGILSQINGRSFMQKDERTWPVWNVNYRKQTVEILGKDGNSVKDFEFTGNLKTVMEAGKDLPVLLADYQRLLKEKSWQYQYCLELPVIEATLAGRKPNVMALIGFDRWKNKDDSRWSSLGYYLEFGKFCLGCSKLGGFRQY